MKIPLRAGVQKRKGEKTKHQQVIAEYQTCYNGYKMLFQAIIALNCKAVTAF
jgi:hypothetical protein